jgi:hypothetical protein
MMGQMALEKPKDFIGEHKTEIVVGSVLTLLTAIGTIAGKHLIEHLHDDAEPGPDVPEPSDNS